MTTRSDTKLTFRFGGFGGYDGKQREPGYLIILSCKCCRDKMVYSRYCDAVVQAVEWTEKVQIVHTSTEPEGPVGLLRKGVVVLATVSYGLVRYTAAGRFCDVHDDCRENRMLGETCFVRNMKSLKLARVRARAKVRARK